LWRTCRFILFPDPHTRVMVSPPPLVFNSGYLPARKCFPLHSFSFPSPLAPLHKAQVFTKFPKAGFFFAAFFPSAVSWLLAQTLLASSPFLLKTAGDFASNLYPPPPPAFFFGFLLKACPPSLPLFCVQLRSLLAPPFLVIRPSPLVTPFFVFFFFPVPPPLLTTSILSNHTPVFTNKDAPPPPFL